MTDTSSLHPTIQDFIQRWEASSAGERANFQSFLKELCDQLGVPHPDPAQPDDQHNAYVFERAVTFHDGGIGRIDLYKRGCFVLEAKQGSDRSKQDALLFEPQSPLKKGRKGTAVRGTKGWDEAMVKARGQAGRYARALPVSEGWPPFLIVVDVGYSIELHADFSRSGKTYLPFPDARSHRILLRDLEQEDYREQLRLIWTDPLALDPSRRSARVTREVAKRLALLAKSFEDAGHDAERVSAFLMRAIFTMFAEDVRLIPPGKFTRLLERLRDKLSIFPQMVSSLWQTMNTGGFSTVLEDKLLQFNGGLFESAEALPVTREQLELLIEASKADWRDVEPAIFGTLLERALNPIERHKLGAHYTPRAYVERLVMPTIIEPLREEWVAVQAAAVTLARNEQMPEAAAEVEAFRRKLCRTRVLDPACGSGNFLYVTMEHMKRLEGEVLDALEGFGEKQAALEYTGLTVDPHQFLGIEVNPRAAVIADLVLWLGYLQWHLRTRPGETPQEPVLKNFHNIECRDAVLAYDRKEIVVDERGQPVMRWDGRTTKKHPVTGEDVPDETARVPLYRYVNARKAEWPEAEFVVGNPPFIGSKRMREVLGHGYAEALRQVYHDVPESSDYVMYWWECSASLARSRAIKRFGFIATNSLRQTFNRKIVQGHLSAKLPLSLLFVIPDHPWVDSGDGAAVRISVTVGEAGEHEGRLQSVISELQTTGEGLDVELIERRGKILADLTIGVNVVGVEPLNANEMIGCRGVVLHGAGFMVTTKDAEKLGLGRIKGLEKHIRPYLNGRDLTQRSRHLMVIDLFGLNAEEVRRQYSEVYQWIYERVKPERDHNNRAIRRENWWIFGEPMISFRSALVGVKRFIATPATAKHRFFVFVPGNVLPDDALFNVALDDAFYLGALSSRIHVTWALAAGGRLGVGNDPRYNKTRCFDPFPFPACDEQQQEKIRALAESLDAHRKRQQSLHPTLTITEMYNVLEKLRAGASLSDKERIIHEQGLVSVLKQIHDELDAAVCEAYGWPTTLTDEEILERLVALNAERAREERGGLIRWLRPEFQNPAGATQGAFITGETAAAQAATGKQEKLAWPKTLAEQAKAVHQALAAQTGVVTTEQLAKVFLRAPKKQVAELLETLVSLGQAREVEEGRFAV